MRQTRRSGEQRRDEIVQAALGIVAEQGAGALSVATVAHRVGVAPSALYRHYADKEAIVQDMLTRLGVGVRANLESARADSERDALEALGDLLSRHVQFILTNRGFPMLIFSDLVTQNAGHRALLLANLTHFRDAVADILRAAQRQGRVRQDLDVESAAVAFFGLFMPPGVFWNMSGGRFDITGQVRRNWAIFAHGISTPAAGGAASAARSAPAARPAPLRRPRGRTHRKEATR